MHTSCQDINYKQSRYQIYAIFGYAHIVLITFIRHGIYLGIYFGIHLIMLLLEYSSGFGINHGHLCLDGEEQGFLDGASCQGHCLFH